MSRRKKREYRPGRRLKIKKINWILGIPATTQDARGLQAEEKALQALQYHQRKETEFPGGWRISAVRPSFHLSMEDLEGKDIIAEFQKGSPTLIEILPIQVKNWQGSETKEEFRQKGICLVVVRPADDDKKARKIVFEALSQWFSSSR